MNRELNCEISHAARAFSLLLAGGALARVMKLTAAALVLSEISSLALRHLAPPAAGLCKTRKRKQRSSELDADFLFRFAERRRFELLIPFWSIHAFQACLLSHSSISPELPCNTDRAANILIIC